MKSINTDIFSYVADIILIPMIQVIIDYAGGFVTDTGLIWPVKIQDGSFVYYDINVVSKEIFLLPSLVSDPDEAEEITKQDQILALQNHIEDFIYVVTQISRILRNDLTFSSICLGLNPSDIQFFINTSFS